MINLIKWIIFYLIYTSNYILNHQNKLSKTIQDCPTEPALRKEEDLQDNLFWIVLPKCLCGLQDNNF